MAPAKKPHLPAAADSPPSVEVEIEAESLEGLFGEATRALCNCMTEVGDVLPHELRVVELVAPDPDRLLLAWLRELIAVFASEGLLFSLARVTITPQGSDGLALEARAWGEPFDAARHALRHPIDKVDPHALRIVHEQGRWRTRLSCRGGSPVA